MSVPNRRKGRRRSEEEDDALQIEGMPEWSRRRPSQQYRIPQVPRRVHILGTGSVGKLVAHSIRGVPNPPPVTLLLHRYSLLKEWEQSPKEIRLTTKGVTEARSGFDVEAAIPKRRKYGQEIIPGQGRGYSDTTNQSAIPAEDQPEPDEEDTPADPIHNLIVTVKAPNTVSALSAVKHRLTRDSTILFLQNGMGILEEANATVFPETSTRPNYMLGIISHGVNSPSSFTATHAGYGTISIGLLPRYEEDTPHTRQIPTKQKRQVWAPSSRYLLRTLTRTPVLAAVGFAPTELLQAQLEKLAINAIVNPLTVLLDARNGAILYNYPITRVMRLLLSEISLVIRSLPELQSIPNVRTRFSPERLETLAVGVAGKTAENVSSMLADSRAGRQTEIEYINGYIVKRGEELGIQCVMNYLVMQLVKGKQMMISQEIKEYAPFAEAELRRR